MRDETTDPKTRQQRGGVKVVAVGPGEAIGPAEFKLGESGCAGVPRRKRDAW